MHRIAASFAQEKTVKSTLYQQTSGLAMFENNFLLFRLFASLPLNGKKKNTDLEETCKKYLKKTIAS